MHMASLKIEILGQKVCTEVWLAALCPTDVEEVTILKGNLLKTEPALEKGDRCSWNHR